MVFLSDVGVSTSLAVRIYKHYAEDSIPVMRRRILLAVDGDGYRSEVDAAVSARVCAHIADLPRRRSAELDLRLSCFDRTCLQGVRKQVGLRRLPRRAAQGARRRH